MHFGNFREKSVKIANQKVSDAFLMTTAGGMQPLFSGSCPKLIFIFDLYRVDTEIAEVHADIARIFSKSIKPLLP